MNGRSPISFSSLMESFIIWKLCQSQISPPEVMKAQTLGYYLGNATPAENASSQPFERTLLRYASGGLLEVRLSKRCGGLPVLPLSTLETAVLKGRAWKGAREGGRPTIPVCIGFLDRRWYSRHWSLVQDDACARNSEKEHRQ